MCIFGYINCVSYINDDDYLLVDEGYLRELTHPSLHSRAHSPTRTHSHTHTSPQVTAREVLIEEYGIEKARAARAVISARLLLDKKVQHEAMYNSLDDNQKAIYEGEKRSGWKMKKMKPSDVRDVRTAANKQAMEVSGVRWEQIDNRL